jgi:RNA polymerase sigma-70 factor (ECF subfamily)
MWAMLPESANDFGDQVADYRNELFAHCYRMLGKVDAAEDALQEALMRAWQARHSYREQISFRAWLYRITTNTCLNAIEARKRDRVEPGPCPDDLLTGVASIEGGPEARYESHESVSLAFLTVMQVLPPRQRAVLLLHDVLAFRGDEVARLLETSVHAVNSALQRARVTLRATYVRPRPVDHAAVLEPYIRAWEAADVASLVALLRADAVLTMPPKPAVAGAGAIGDFLAQSMFPTAPMRLAPARANLSTAYMAYVKQQPFALLVIDADGKRIARIHAFADPLVLARFGLAAAASRPPA